MTKDYINLKLSYSKDFFIDEESLQKYYDGDIIAYLKEFLADDGKFAFIDCFEIEDMEEING